MTLQRLAQRFALQVADIAGETVIHLVLQLVAGDGNLFCIDDDQVVARINVGGVNRLVLAAQTAGQFGSQTAKGLAFGVNEVPVALDGLVLCSESAHKELC